MGPGGVQVRNLEIVAKQGLLDAIPEDDVKRIRNLVCLDPNKPAPHAPVGVEEIGGGPAIGIAAEGCLALWSEPGQELAARSEEHTSELQSLMRISYAGFSLKKKKKN